MVQTIGKRLSFEFTGPIGEKWLGRVCWQRKTGGQKNGLQEFNHANRFLRAKEKNLFGFQYSSNSTTSRIAKIEPQIRRGSGGY